MERVPGVSIAANRARWLAELSESLAQAHTLLLRLDATTDGAMELHLRIEGARLTVKALQLRSMGHFSEPADPKWMNSPLQQWPEEQES